MNEPNGDEPLDILNDFLVDSEHYVIRELGGTGADDFVQLRRPYLIEGDVPPFVPREATDEELRTLCGEQYTFVEDWRHVPSGRLIHIAYQRLMFGGSPEWDEPTVFLGTDRHMVFAVERREDGAVAVIPAPREQWETIGERTGQWWGRGLYNDEYTDFFMYGLYRLPMHYRVLSRNDYEDRRGQSAAEIIAELTGLGYEYVGEISWSQDGMTESFTEAPNRA